MAENQVAHACETERRLLVVNKRQHKRHKPTTEICGQKLGDDEDTNITPTNCYHSQAETGVRNTIAKKRGSLLGPFVRLAVVVQTVHGPCPDSLLRPTETLLTQARAAGEVLGRLAEHYKDAGDGTGIYAEECKKAVDSLRRVSWAAIRDEKFHLTPQGAIS